MEQKAKRKCCRLFHTTKSTRLFHRILYSVFGCYSLNTADKHFILASVERMVKDQTKC